MSKRCYDDVQFPSLFSERISFARVSESAPRGYSFRRRQAELQVTIVTASGRAVREEGVRSWLRCRSVGVKTDSCPSCMRMYLLPRKASTLIQHLSYGLGSRMKIAPTSTGGPYTCTVLLGIA